ncbi:aldehyde dehydrogenase family protein [Harryflintia acetispora]|uniref:Succinate-semialdehyde dehydrogenase/glutarate-semialdehyde dehydrogenase n=1 Tax=Harryflintia acetispora TaxID=1849041 RepID=A0A9X8Y8Y5_9FIRM|nr:aldehyde dehydrogenase family protein [Harryflintia acetispora]TCL44201.1 succinate-semialdehyde dehydrogenase/glutarate-semialdehyde dehydrogenase [Harryflintia acetispora]
MVKQYIDGMLVDGLGEPFGVCDPATGEEIATIGAATAQQAEAALLAAQRAFSSWSKTTMDERVAWLHKFRNALLAEKDFICDLLSRETGKPFRVAVEDFDWCTDCLQFYAEEVRRVYGTSLPCYNRPYGNTYHIVEKRPLGVIVGHLAWNYPLGNAGFKIGPTIASGCTCVLKPSSDAPLATLYMGEIAHRIGLPAGVLNILAGPVEELGPALNSSTIPKMITLIGSSRSGRMVMAQGATSIKRYSLELGGNAPCIVMEDADLALAAKSIVDKKTSNSGQMCTDYNRIYIHESIYERMTGLVLENLRQVKLGKHREEGNTMGPMITRAARDRMFELLADAKQRGARLLCGGETPAGYEQGNWITPALLADVTEDMRVSREEIFGPIIALRPYRDLSEVLRLAVDTEYGLASYLFGHDARKLSQAFEALEFGEVFVNDAGGGPQLPHVGVKQSGIGCDSSAWSLDEYYELRRIAMIP